MNKIKTVYLVFIFLISSIPVLGQDNSTKLLEARILLNDYQDASKFRNESTGKFDPAWVNIFRNCFDTATRKIIFDVPLTKKVHLSRIDDGQKAVTEITNLYLQYVSINQYIDSIRSIYQRADSIDFNYRFIESGYDTTYLQSQKRMVFIIEKQFAKTSWSAPKTKTYLFEIKFTDGGPKIASIQVKDVDFAKTDVELMFIEVAGKKGDVAGQGIADVVSRIKIDFDDDIDDRVLTDKSNAQGKIKLGLVANRARIFIDTIYGTNGLKYSIPPEWKAQGTKANQRQVGKRVNQQPVGGFKIPLKPYRWSGWTFTPLIYGGLISQSTNDLHNFSGDSEFTNSKGYKLGAGVDVAYFFNPDNWKKNSGNWIFGVGSGFSVSYFQFNTSSNGFQQNPYDWSDQSGDTCKILVSGTSLEELISTIAISVPVYLEIKKRLHQKIFSMRAFSIQAGVNLMLPLNSTYDATGIFSRHGLYPEYNNQIITNDSFYNYFTDQKKTYSGQIDYKPLIAEGMIKLNGFFDIFNNNSDNTLNVGLQFSFPFTNSTSFKTSDYYILSGNDEYSSLAYSKKDIYKYYFGISVGINLIKFKVD